jgi:hypothetical protein
VLTSRPCCSSCNSCSPAAAAASAAGVEANLYLKEVEHASQWTGSDWGKATHAAHRPYTAGAVADIAAACAIKIHQQRTLL